MALMPSLQPLLAILWAQWRTSANFFLRANKLGVVVRWLTNLLWYGFWAAAAGGAAVLASGRIPISLLERGLASALFFVFFFWQMFPIVVASQGAYLDLRRLLVYPIPQGQFFLLEVALRVTTAIEMLLVSAGLAIGVALNKELPAWAPGIVILYILLNLLLSCGVKSLFGRLFQRRGVREVVMVLFIAFMVLPQIFVARIQETGLPKLGILRQISPYLSVLPWAAAADAILGKSPMISITALVAGTWLAYLFARYQFSRTLHADEGPSQPAKTIHKESVSVFDRLVRLPSLLLSDPAAIMVEKDLRTLARSPRFRLIFMMASTLGSVLWLPAVTQNRNSWFAQNYVTMAVLYGMLVLGEVVYWNVLGFERAGAQMWFVTPLPFRAVLRAKNLVAVICTGLVVAILGAVALVLPVPVGIPQILDAALAATVFLVFLLGAGNLTSVYTPKPVDGDQAWRNASGKTQFLLLIVYPFLSIPIVLAYLARWATGNFMAYHAVLGVCLIAGLCFYNVATETAAETGEERKELIVETLARREGPISGSAA